MREILEYMLEYGIDLGEHHVSNFAFYKKDALELLNLLEAKKVRVLGGDLLKLNEEIGFKYIYMNWSTSSVRSIKETIDYTRDYITKYMNDEILTTFVTSRGLYGLIYGYDISKKAKISELLRDLINPIGNFKDILMNVYESDWKKRSDINIILYTKNILKVLKLYSSKAISEKELKDWVELIELREDIIYDLENKELISDIMVKLKFINIDLCDDLVLKLSFL